MIRSLVEDIQLRVELCQTSGARMYFLNFELNKMKYQVLITDR